MTGLNYLIIGDVLPSTDSIGELALPLPSTKPVNLGSCSQPCILESPRKLLKQSPFPISKKKKILLITYGLASAVFISFFRYLNIYSFQLRNY